MPRAELSSHIERSPDEVFAFVSEPANNASWRSNVESTVWLDDGPMRIGRRGRQTARVLGRRMTVEAVIVEWDPPRSVRWRVVQGPATVDSWYRVEPEGTGSRVTGGAEGEMHGFFGRILNPLVAPVMKRQARGYLEKLKQILEQPPE